MTATLRDSWTMTRRELTQLRYAPGELLGMVIFPGIMVVLFGYVFGSAIHLSSGGNYREFLMPGLFAMTALTGVMLNALLTSKDVAAGVMDRFRSMPIARSAVPAGRAMFDLIGTALGLAVMAVIGLIVGWSAHRGVALTAAAFGLIILMRYSLSWVGTYLGLRLTPETADQFVPLVFPVSMLSNSFVPTSGMPGWLQAISNWNPISALVAACRDLFGNPAPAAAHVWPLQHPVVASVGWSLLLLVIFVPLATRRYSVRG
jgi:ABC-2 type transport system permease protein